MIKVTNLQEINCITNADLQMHIREKAEAKTTEAKSSQKKAETKTSELQLSIQPMPSGALEELLHRLACCLGGIHDNGHSLARILAADQIADQLDLSRGHAYVAYNSSCFHVTLTPPYLPLLEVLLPACPL